MSILLLLCFAHEPPANWHQHQSPDKRITLSFPRVPIEQVKSQQMAQGETQVTTITVQRTKVEESGLVLTWFDVKKPKTSEGEIKQYLNGVETGSIKARNGERIHTKSITVEKHHGREFTWKTEQAFIRSQIIMTKDRFITLMYMAETEQGLTSHEANTFFQSLKLKD
jgi:hypothetical protein